MTKRNGGNWTEARYRTFVRSALRAAFRKWPPKFAVLKSAATNRRINPKTGREAMHYKCAACDVDFPAKDVQVDHIKPIVSVAAGFKTWDDFINKLFCEAKNLQVLCKPCHKVKTGHERKKRGK
jgi:5-methylcytosine-specific restriction endonuclease McrA